MTCAACGSVLAQDVRFCPHCGAPVASPPPGYNYQPGPPPPYTRVARNLQPLGILWLVYAGLRTMTGLLGVVFLHGLFGVRHYNYSGLGSGWGPFGSSWLAALWPMALGTLLISVGVSVLVGCALLTRQSWARVLAIIFGIIALIHFPLGTALGIYTLWVLVPRASGEEYDALAYFHRQG